MANDATKQLIALLAQAGGFITIPLADLQQLGIEFTITDLGSADATLRLRLGPKIYYVPDKAAPPQEATWPATTPATPPSAKAQSTLDADIEAVNNLNNRPRRPRPAPPEEPPPSLHSDEARPPSASISTEAERQEELTSPLPPLRRVVPKTDMDLFLREQQIATQKETASQRRAAKDRQRGRQYPWETRNAPSLKM